MCQTALLCGESLLSLKGSRDNRHGRRGSSQGNGTQAWHEGGPGFNPGTLWFPHTQLCQGSLWSAELGEARVWFKDK